MDKVTVTEADKELFFQIRSWRPTDADQKQLEAIAAHRLAAKAEVEALRAENERRLLGLKTALRAAELALFVIRKQGVMPNSSWEAGFESDLADARKALDTEGSNNG